MMLRIIQSVILLFIVEQSISQNYNLELLNKLYPSQPIVYLLKEESASISNIKNELIVTNHVKEQFIILNENGKSFDTKSIYTSQFIEAKNIKAYNYVLSNKKYNKVAVDNIKVAEVSSDNSFYDGSKRISIKFPSSDIGNIIEIEYDELYKEPRFFGSFYASEYYPVIKASYTLKYPNTVVVNSKGFNTETLKLKFTEKHTKSDNILSWAIDSIPPFKAEKNSPGFRYMSAYYLFSIKEYVKDGVNTPLVGTVDNLYKWYLDLVKNLNKTPSPQLKQITDSLVAGCKTDQEKLKKIYYWVQDKIAYIAYEDGLGGYVPREADIIYKRRFGDCKDMASILTEMGRDANLPVYLTWIGTNDIPYQFSEVPAPMAANHMIATYYTKDTCLFLDATGKFQDLGQHTSMIQGKEAIIGLSDKDYKIVKVPSISYQKNYYTDSVIISINKNTVVGKGVLTVDGYYKVSLQDRVSSKSYKEQFDILTDYFEKGNNKFKLDTFIIEQNKRDVPLVISYKFKISNYITESDKEVFININFDRNYLSEFFVKDRQSPIEFNFEFEKNLSVTLQCNNDYMIKHVPENLAYTSDVAEYKATYTTTNNSVRFNSKIMIKSMLIRKNNFDTWNSFISEQNKNNNKSVYLNKL